MNPRLLGILRLSRAHFLIPGLMLYVFGILFARAMGADLDQGRNLLGYAIFGLAHLSVSFSNDYFDRKGDGLGRRTAFSGGSGVLQQFPDLQRLALGIAVGLTGLSMVLGAVFTLVYAYPPSFMLFVAIGSLMAWSYSAPPLRLSYRGWGEVSTALAAGFLMPGMGYFVAMGELDIWFVMISLPLVCYGFYFIFTVEMPDLESDKKAGKVNLLVLLGSSVGFIGALVATSGGTLLLLLLAALGSFEGEVDMWLLVLFSLIPLSIAAAGALRRPATERGIRGQMRMNLASMMVLLLLADLILMSGPAPP